MQFKSHIFIITVYLLPLIIACKTPGLTGAGERDAKLNYVYDDLYRLTIVEQNIEENTYYAFKVCLRQHHESQHCTHNALKTVDGKPVIFTKSQYEDVKEVKLIKKDMEKINQWRKYYQGMARQSKGAVAFGAFLSLGGFATTVIGVEIFENFYEALADDIDVRLSSSTPYRTYEDFLAAHRNTQQALATLTDSAKEFMEKPLLFDQSLDLKDLYKATDTSGLWQEYSALYSAEFKNRFASLMSSKWKLSLFPTDRIIYQTILEVVTQYFSDRPSKIMTAKYRQRFQEFVEIDDFLRGLSDVNYAHLFTKNHEKFVQHFINFAKNRGMPAKLADQ
ncbi:MAG: hypothetical protein OXC40_06230, partial [Proteobacteria bacterium]|nr:hypothetical protein [Pseudomonadota bacterium]